MGSNVDKFSALKRNAEKYWDENLEGWKYAEDQFSEEQEYSNTTERRTTLPRQQREATPAPTLNGAPSFPQHTGEEHSSEDSSQCDAGLEEKEKKLRKLKNQKKREGTR